MEGVVKGRTTSWTKQSDLSSSKVTEHARLFAIIRMFPYQTMTLTTWHCQLSPLFVTRDFLLRRYPISRPLGKMARQYQRVLPSHRFLYQHYTHQRLRVTCLCESSRLRKNNACFPSDLLIVASVTMCSKPSASSKVMSPKALCPGTHLFYHSRGSLNRYKGTGTWIPAHHSNLLHLPFH